MSVPRQWLGGRRALHPPGLAQLWRRLTHKRKPFSPRVIPFPHTSPLVGEEAADPTGTTGLDLWPCRADEGRISDQGRGALLHNC